MAMEIQISFREDQIAAKVQVFSMASADARQFNKQVEMLKRVLTMIDKWEEAQTNWAIAHPAKPKAVANG